MFKFCIFSFNNCTCTYVSSLFSNESKYLPATPRAPASFHPPLPLNPAAVHILNSACCSSYLRRSMLPLRSRNVQKILHLSGRTRSIRPSLVLPASFHSPRQTSFFSSSATSAVITNSSVPRTGGAFVTLQNNRNTTPRTPVSYQPKRYCSYRRMCHARQNGDDVVGSAANVAQGREVLPTNVKPLHYDLTLEPDFEKFTFKGTVAIEYVVPYLYLYAKIYCLLTVSV